MKKGRGGKKRKGKKRREEKRGEEKQRVEEIAPTRLETIAIVVFLVTVYFSLKFGCLAIWQEFNLKLRRSLKIVI